jgi:DNA-binding MarR family transcriptional regulator
MLGFARLPDSCNCSPGLGIAKVPTPEAPEESGERVNDNRIAIGGLWPQRYAELIVSAKLLPEQEILSACACHKTRMAMRSVTRAYDEALRPIGLRATQLLLLVAIAAEGAMSISALADAIGMDRSTLTRNVKPLEKEGLIQRGGEGWRRSRALKVTSAGRALMSKAIPLWESAQENLRRKLGQKDWATVHAGLDRLINVA